MFTTVFIDAHESPVFICQKFDNVKIGDHMFINNSTYEVVRSTYYMGKAEEESPIKGSTLELFEPIQHVIIIKPVQVT